MKLTYQQLSYHLLKPLKSIYIISGDEAFLRQDAVQQIKKAAKKTGFLSTLRFSYENDAHWNALYTELNTPSLFAEKRVIELDLRQTTSIKALDTLLKEYIEKPTPDILLLIHLDKLDAKISKQAWYAAAEQHGITLALWPISRDQLPAWLIQRAKKYKMALSLPVANFLAEYTEGHLAAAAQAIEKLYLLQPDTPITEEIIASVFADESRFTTFDVVDHLLAGNQARTLHSLRQLRLEGIEPVLILWSITRELRLLSAIATEMSQQGGLTDTLLKKHRVFPRRQPLIQKFLSKHTANDCHSLLQNAATIDRMIKGALDENHWEALEIFCLRV